MSIQIQLRRGTADAWTNNNPILAYGEPGYEKETGKLKIGDGITSWNQLPYLVGEGEGDNDADNILNLTTGSGENSLQQDGCDAQAFNSVAVGGRTKTLRGQKWEVVSYTTNASKRVTTLTLNTVDGLDINDVFYVTIPYKLSAGTANTDYTTFSFSRSIKSISDNTIYFESPADMPQRFYGPATATEIERFAYQQHCFMVPKKDSEPSNSYEEGSGGAHAEGGQSYTFLRGAHAEGIGTNAMGIGAHSEGCQTNAFGQTSHTEGYETIALNKSDHAEGYVTIASGGCAHAEGIQTMAQGRASHTEGTDTIAKNDNSHAEGLGSKTLPSQIWQVTDYIFNAELKQPTSLILNTIEDLTVGMQFYSVIKYIRDAYNTTAHFVFEGTISDIHDDESLTVDIEVANEFKIENFISATTMSTSYIDSYFFVPSYNGHAQGTYFAPIGEHAEGNETCAYEGGTHAEGNATIAYLPYAHAEGHSSVAIGSGSHAEGIRTKALGAYSHTEGRETNAIGQVAHAEGYKTNAIGQSAHAEGHETEALGWHTHAEGRGTKALGTCSHAEGYYASTEDAYSHAEGYYSYTVQADECVVIDADTTTTESEGTAVCVALYTNIVPGYHSANNYCYALLPYTTTQGEVSVAPIIAPIGSIEQHVDTNTYKIALQSAVNLPFDFQQVYSHIELVPQSQRYCFSLSSAQAVTAPGPNYGGGTHAEGLKTIAIMAGSHAEGHASRAIGFSTHAEGSLTFAAMEGCHAEGARTNALGPASHAEGHSTKTTHTASHAEGYGTTADADFAHVEGQNTIAQQPCQHVQGKFNRPDTATSADVAQAFIIGNGTSTTANARANALSVDWTGNVMIAGEYKTETGADYAEYFEWLDGNPNNEDRVGYIVALNEDKITLANSNDEIFGIVSGTAAVVGDTATWDWQGKYLTDEFGRVIWDMVEEFSEVPETEAIQVADEDGNITTEYKTTMVTKSIGFFPHRRLNPDYDESQTYIPRSKRPEWDCVGLMGKLHVRDDGTCIPGSYATAGMNGIATYSSEKTNLKVMKRLSDNIILVFMK